MRENAGLPTTQEGEPDWEAVLDELGIETSGRPLYRIGDIVFRVHCRAGSDLRVNRMYVVDEDPDQLDIGDLYHEYTTQGLSIERVTPEYLPEPETVAVPSRVEIADDAVYVRDDDGHEVVSWTADEWTANPEAVVPALLEAVTIAPIDIQALKRTLSDAGGT